MTLVLGEARSGKTRFAQQLANHRGGDILLVDTAAPGDRDHISAIARNHTWRRANWQTVEIQRGLGHTLSNSDPVNTVVIDSVTLWVTNMLLAEEIGWEAAQAELNDLLIWFYEHGSNLIIVSNEFSSNINPNSQLSRTFHEWLANFNQRLAQEADAVYMMVAGRPVDIKSFSMPLAC